MLGLIKQFLLLKFEICSLSSLKGNFKEKFKLDSEISEERKIFNVRFPKR